MTKPKLAALVLTLLAAATLPVACGGCGGGRVPAEFRPEARLTAWSDDDWAFVLDEVATDRGFVEWDKIESNANGVRDALFRYVGQIGRASPENRPDLFPTDRDVVAYYVNAYNALCMYGVVKRGYPSNVLQPNLVDPGVLFFVDRFYVGGGRTNLDTLEQTTLDRTGRDPRLHFAFNCMSYSCPPLRREPFAGDRLAAQLKDQGDRYLTDPRAAVRDDADTVRLNKIFTGYYRDDFTRGVEGGRRRAAARGRLAVRARRLAGGGGDGRGRARVRVGPQPPAGRRVISATRHDREGVLSAKPMSAVVVVAWPVMRPRHSVQQRVLVDARPHAVVQPQPALAREAARLGQPDAPRVLRRDAELQPHQPRPRRPQVRAQPRAGPRSSPRRPRPATTANSPASRGRPAAPCRGSRFGRRPGRPAGSRIARRSPPPARPTR